MARVCLEVHISFMLCLAGKHNLHLNVHISLFHLRALEARDVFVLLSGSFYWLSKPSFWKHNNFSMLLLYGHKAPLEIHGIMEAAVWSMKQAKKTPQTSEDQSREVQSAQLAQDMPELLSSFAFFLGWARISFVTQNVPLSILADTEELDLILFYKEPEQQRLARISVISCSSWNIFVGQQKSKPWGCLKSLCSSSKWWKTLGKFPFDFWRAQYI